MEVGESLPLNRETNVDLESIQQWIDESGWGEAYAHAAKNPPTIVTDAKSFVDELYYGGHLDDIVVFPGGLEKMNQLRHLPEYVSDVVVSSKSVRNFLEDIEPAHAVKLDCRLYRFPNGVREDEEAARRDQDGNPLDNLSEKLREIRRTNEEGPLYMTELRFHSQYKYRHKLDNDWTKTILTESFKDYVGKDKAQRLPYWDRYSEGVFIGDKNTGSGLHMDQCLWSNIGKNYHGYKLLAIWKFGDLDVMEDHLRNLFTPPLSKNEQRALKKACRLVLVGPGDCFLFSGANPHMAITIGPHLSCTAYESFINFHPTHLRVFLSSNNDKVHHWDCHMSRRTLKDLKWDVVDCINDSLDLVEDGKVNPIQDGKIVDALNTAVTVLREGEGDDAEWWREELYTPFKKPRSGSIHNGKERKLSGFQVNCSVEEQVHSRCSSMRVNWSENELSGSELQQASPPLPTSSLSNP